MLTRQMPRYLRPPTAPMSDDTDSFHTCALLGGKSADATSCCLQSATSRSSKPMKACPNMCAVRQEKELACVYVCVCVCVRVRVCAAWTEIVNLPTNYSELQTNHTCARKRAAGERTRTRTRAHTHIHTHTHTQTQTHTHTRTHTRACMHTLAHAHTHTHTHTHSHTPKHTFPLPVLHPHPVPVPQQIAA